MPFNITLKSIGEPTLRANGNSTQCQSHMKNITWVQPDFMKHSEQMLGYGEVTHAGQLQEYFVHKSCLSLCLMFVKFFSAHLTISLSTSIMSTITPLSQRTGFVTIWQLHLRSKQNTEASQKRRWSSAEPAISGRLSRSKPDHPVQLHVNY